ncbi:MAG: flagellar basal body P-ring formation chaperone FlgA [Woeseiaceae bacterium]
MAGQTLALVLVCGWAAAAQAGGNTGGDGAHLETQPVSDISQAAEQYLQQRLGATGRQVAPRAGQLDPRLQLPRCDQALEAFLREGRIDQRTVVGVRCSGSRPWKVYVPVDVVEMRPVLVARRSLPRDHVLLAEDLLAEQRDVSRLVGGYVSEPEEIVGQRLKRRLVSGTVISAGMLQERIVIRRGQSVTLVVTNDALSIRMAGTALTDGSLNERIRVENTTSERVVEGIVRSAQYVEILVQ